MSIKTFSTLPRMSPPAHHGTERKTGGNDAFASRLEEVLRQPKDTIPEVSRAALEARLLVLTMTRGLLDESPAGGRDYFPSLHLPVNSSLPGINEVFQPLSGRNFDTPIRAFDRTLQESQAVESSSTPAPPTLDDIIDRAASRYGVDQELIRAVIRTESGFDPDAISPVGAQGLMQLMPETAKELGVSDPLDAEQNVMGGTRYLRRLLDRYDGDLDRALAAYNWGMGNVERRGMEQMPQETRNYLAKVKKAGNLA